MSTDRRMFRTDYDLTPGAEICSVCNGTKRTEDSPYLSKHCPACPRIGVVGDCPKDPIVESVRAKLLQRSQVGMAKYGVGLDRTDLTPLEWIDHWQHENMDASLYAERLRQEVTALIAIRESVKELVAEWKDRSRNMRNSDASVSYKPAHELVFDLADELEQILPEPTP